MCMRPSCHSIGTELYKGTGDHHQSVCRLSLIGLLCSTASPSISDGIALSQCKPHMAQFFHIIYLLTPVSPAKVGESKLSDYLENGLGTLASASRSSYGFQTISQFWAPCFITAFMTHTHSQPSPHHQITDKESEIRMASFCHLGKRTPKGTNMSGRL